MPTKTTILITACLLIFISGFFAEPSVRIGGDLTEATIDEKIDALPITEDLKTEVSTLTTSEKELVEPLLKEQIDYQKLEKDGKYKTVMPTTDETTDIEYWVDEYDAPPYDGSGKGYQVYMKRGDGMVKSFGEGKEAEARTHDWKIPNDSPPVVKITK